MNLRSVIKLEKTTHSKRLKGHVDEMGEGSRGRSSMEQLAQDEEYSVRLERGYSGQGQFSWTLAKPKKQTLVK